MDKVYELLDSIPEKVVQPGAQKRLKLLLKSLQHDHGFIIKEGGKSIPECIQIICSIIDKNKTAYSPLIPEDQFSLINKAISDLKILVMQGDVPLLSLLSIFLKSNVPLPLELLMLLQKSDIMILTTYLSKYTEENKDISWFTNSLTWLVKDNATKHHSIIVPLLSTLVAVREAGSLHCAQDLALLSLSISDSFCTQVSEWVQGLTEDDISTNEINYLSGLDASGQLSKSAVWTFAFTHLIKLTSTHTPDQIIPMSDVPKFQSKKWKLSIIPLPLKSLLLEVVAAVGPDEVLRCILSCLGKPEVNWRILLLLTSSVLHTDTGAAKSKDFIDQLLRRGLECDSQLDLGASLLFARQCCQEASSQFGTYSQWFGAHFGVGAASARSANQFRTLLELLVALVPAETPGVLRVPKAPTSCHGLLRDYTELARARLDELNEPAEMGGLFMDSYDGEQDTRAQDVGRVLQHFLKTEKVLKVVLEAAVFRRKYFEGVFLVELLRLPGWSQQELPAEESETRHAFIDKLKSLDKIPPKLYSAYKSSGGGDKIKESGKFEPRTMKHQLSAPETDSAQKNKGRLQIKKKR